MKIIAAVFEPNKMHVYDVKTTGRHPVHMIEGGEYLTEDERQFEESGDMGWFYLNQKEYDYFKSQCREIDIPYTEEERLKNQIEYLNNRTAYLEKENTRLVDERNDAIQLANHLQDDYSRAFKRMQDMQVEIDTLKAQLKEK